MKRLPISMLAKRFGNPGRRIWYMCQGQDPDPLHYHDPVPKSVGHGKVMPPKTTDESVIRMYLAHMAEKVAARLRKHALSSSVFSIGLLSEYGWLGKKYRPSMATNDGQVIRPLCERMLIATSEDQGWNTFIALGMATHTTRTLTTRRSCTAECHL